METISQHEAGRRLGLNQMTISEWCDPRTGLVRLRAHPLVSPAEFEELEWIAKRRKEGTSLQQLRLVVERGRARREGLMTAAEEFGAMMARYQFSRNPAFADALEAQWLEYQKDPEAATDAFVKGLRAEMARLEGGSRPFEGVSRRRVGHLVEGPGEPLSTGSAVARCPSHASSFEGEKLLLETTFGEKLGRLYEEYAQRAELECRPVIDFARWMELSKGEHAALHAAYARECERDTPERHRSDAIEFARTSDPHGYRAAKAEGRLRW